MRKPIIAGNWKMNKTPDQTIELIEQIKPLAKGALCDVVVCVPFVDLPAAAAALRGSEIGLGAQNMHFAPSGAFTGEISAEMLKSLGVQYVILGHSERRQFFAETDETVRKKTAVALQMGFTPIVCVGESLSQRESGVTAEVVSSQTVAALSGLESYQVKNVVIAYEPIWAIGTGRTATCEQADEAIALIRKTVGDAFGRDVAEAVRIQYGGSMNAENAPALMRMPNIDGGLIGGASLKAADFGQILDAASQPAKESA